MKNIKKLLNEELQIRYQIQESFDRISSIKDKEKKEIAFINLVGNLLNEGYNEEKIDNILTEQVQQGASWLKRLFSNAQTGNKLLTGGILSRLKEWLIEKILAIFGLKGDLAKSFATALSEMRVMELINIVRSEKGCLQSARPVVKGLLEGIFRYILATGFNKETKVTNYLRNIFFEMINRAEIDAKLATALCGAIYNMKKVDAPQPPAEPAPQSPETKIV
jgi:hypothetical protein